MRRCVRSAAALALGASFALATLRARAADSRVRLELRGCADLSESTLREHLELELATLGLSRVEVRLQLVCGSGVVALELSRATGERYPVQVRVALSDTAKAARERLVALAATELVAQAERAPENERSGAVPAVPARAPKTLQPESVAVAPARSRSPRLELLIAGSAALDGAPRATLWGGSLGSSWRAKRAWSVLVDTRFERGQESLRLADVRWTLLSGFLGVGVNANLARLRLSAGIGVRAGWLSLAARARLPNEGLGFTAPWAGVAAPLRVALDVGGFVAPFVGCEAGYVLAPVRGKVDDGSVLVEQRGVWISGSLGVAVAL